MFAQIRVSSCTHPSNTLCWKKTPVAFCYLKYTMFAQIIVSSCTHPSNTLCWKKTPVAFCYLKYTMFAQIKVSSCTYPSIYSFLEKDTCGFLLLEMHYVCINYSFKLLPLSRTLYGICSFFHLNCCAISMSRVYNHIVWQ